MNRPTNYKVNCVVLALAPVATRLACVGAIVLAFASCHRRQPVALRRMPAVSRDAAATLDAADSEEPVENVPVWRFIKQWSVAHARHDVNALATMYGDRVSFYGERRSRDDVLAAKRTTFESAPNYSHQVFGIKTRVGVGDYTVSTFLTVSGTTEHPRSLETKLVVGQSDGGPLLILEEAAEKTSDEQNSACEEIAAEVTNNLPIVKQYRAQVDARINASHGRMQLAGISPQDLSDPGGFFATSYVQSDDGSDTVVESRVDREGVLTVIVGHEGAVEVPAAALRKVEKVCKR